MIGNEKPARGTTGGQRNDAGALCSDIDDTRKRRRRQPRTMREICAPMLAVCERNRRDPRFARVGADLVALVERWTRRGR